MQGGLLDGIMIYASPTPGWSGAAARRMPWDALGIFQQIGAIPVPREATS